MFPQSVKTRLLGLSEALLIIYGYKKLSQSTAFTETACIGVIRTMLTQACYENHIDSIFKGHSNKWGEQPL